MRKLHFLEDKLKELNNKSEKIITPPILRRIINEGDEPVRTSASKLRGKSRLEELRGGGGTGVNRPSGTELERGKSRLEELRRQ